uniref:Uncharacterized protein n=1 Tax=Haptolina brevifila TaxID=156173 RepID=A0A7S2DQ30_9EUKA|eukprot:CAMPEP_0174697310 /NCGR_PEP_ID=MMETSP1094-20130205/3206_1 /TAXON_ID=156173 /ORGANISM="Chrysochromulina brevifilum, Strain UTEX LB 985" /LENGTH=242 /DNA_ID=CAMNT_0015894261 /DNA_START=147 /DNA_END=875 /DNA_ORIENTATION=-
MNMLASVFIFELDELFYGHMPKSWVRRYTTSPSLFKSRAPLASKANRTHPGVTADLSTHMKRKQQHELLEFLFSWALFAINLAFTFLFYWQFVAPNAGYWPRPASNFYFWLAQFTNARATMFTIAQVVTHHSEHTYLHDWLPSKPHITTALHCLLYAIVSIGCGFLSFQVLYLRIFDLLLGSQTVFYPMGGSIQYKCLNMEYGEEMFYKTGICHAEAAQNGFPPNQTGLSPSYTYESWYGSP